MLINKRLLATYVAHGFPIVLPSDEVKTHCQEQIIKWANEISVNIWAYESVISPHGVMLAPGNDAAFIHVMMDDNRIVLHFFDDMEDLEVQEKTQIAAVCQGLFVFLTAYAMMNNMATPNNVIIENKSILDKNKKKYAI